MLILSIWFVIALVVAMVFGSMARRSGNNLEREITTRIAGGQHNHTTK